MNTLHSDDETFISSCLSRSYVNIRFGTIIFPPQRNIVYCRNVGSIKRQTEPMMVPIANTLRVVTAGGLLLASATWCCCLTGAISPGSPSDTHCPISEPVAAGEKPSNSKCCAGGRAGRESPAPGRPSPDRPCSDCDWTTIVAVDFSKPVAGEIHSDFFPSICRLPRSSRPIDPGGHDRDNRSIVAGSHETFRGDSLRSLSCLLTI